MFDRNEENFLFINSWYGPLKWLCWGQGFTLAASQEFLEATGFTIKVNDGEVATCS